MKTIRIIAIILIVIVILIVLAYVLFGHSASPTTPSSTATFPSASTSSASSTTGQSSSATMAVKTQDGKSMIVKNFTTNGVTVADLSNPGNYYLTGGAPGEFSILYNASASSFTVSLDQEPIGETRLHAQAFLADALGVTQQQLCSLDSFVTTTSDVNATYAGESLGFSSCPGAVPLPQ